MKTNFKYLTLVVAALLIGLSSCSKDDVTNGSTKNDTKSVFLKISNAPVTYAEGAAQANAPLSFSSGHLYFTDDAGTILRYHSVGAEGADFTMTELTTGKEIAELPITVTAVHVVGNTEGLPNATTISAIKSHVLNVASQVEVTAGNIVNLYGETTTLTKVDETNTYKAAVTIAPTVARIQLTDIKAKGRVTSFKVVGIFVDNYYAEAQVDGTISSALVDNGKVATDFVGDSGKYPATLKSSVYDWYTDGLASVGNVVKPEKAVWGYNLFAKANGSNDFPRIIIRLTDIVTSGGASFANPQFITIKGFNDASAAALTTIVPGKVYTIATAGFSFDETNLTPDPNMETKAVSVEVGVTSWDNIPITPNM